MKKHISIRYHQAAVVKSVPALDIHAEIREGFRQETQMNHYFMFALAFDARGETEWVDYYLAHAAKAELVFTRAMQLLDTLHV